MAPSTKVSIFSPGSPRRLPPPPPSADRATVLPLLRRQSGGEEIKKKKKKKESPGGRGDAGQQVSREFDNLTADSISAKVNIGFGGLLIISASTPAAFYSLHGHQINSRHSKERGHVSQKRRACRISHNSPLLPLARPLAFRRRNSAPAPAWQAAHALCEAASCWFGKIITTVTALLVEAAGSDPASVSLH